MVSWHSGALETTTQHRLRRYKNIHYYSPPLNTTINRNLMHTSCMTIKQELIYHYYHSIKPWERYWRCIESITSQLSSITHLIIYIKYQQIMTWSTDNKSKYYSPATHTSRLIHLCYRLVHELLLIRGYWYFRGLIIACTFCRKICSFWVINCGWSSVKWCFLT